MSEALMFETRPCGVFTCGGCGQVHALDTTSQDTATRWAKQDGWLIDENEADADRCPTCQLMGDLT